jgi:predicted CoA-substrate-specific enzyme activase
MTTAGIDIGSVATKAVIQSNGHVLGKALLKTGTDPRSAGEEAFSRALADAGLTARELPCVATGYGRSAANTGARTITEILAAARGAHLVVPGADGVIDLGGQDTKVIRLAADGTVADFAMNDKCAAGTGRFLELMVSALSVDFDRLGKLAEAASKPARINSTCAVFAESEVVSLIARSVPESDIAAGLFASIASRVAALTAHVGGASRYAFIGGGARTPALRRALEVALGRELIVPPDPQFVVALGAALIAAEPHDG